MRLPVVPLALLALTATALTPAPVAAQQTSALYGTVRDSTGRALEDVQIVILTTGSATRTDAGGRYLVDSLSAGMHRVLYRRLGYRQLDVSFVLGECDSLEISPRLASLATELDPVVVTGRRTGIFGVVGDLTYQPMAEVTVEVLGTSRRAVTDSTGRFAFPDIAAGGYILQVRHRQHWLVRRSVSLPPGEERELSILMTPLASGLSRTRARLLAGFAPMDEIAAWDMTSRRIRCGGPRAIVVPREELTSQGNATLDQVLIRAPSAAARGFSESELRNYGLYVDGRAYPDWPLRAIKADDVEAVEIYPAAATGRFRASFGNSRPDPFARAAAMCPTGTIWVWLIQ